MPRKKVRASANAPTSPADALIAAAQARGAVAVAVPETARVELEKILAYNDTLPPSARARVNLETALELMQKLGWNVRSHHTLNTYCRTTLGRRSYGTP